MINVAELLKSLKDQRNRLDALIGELEIEVQPEKKKTRKTRYEIDKEEFDKMYNKSILKKTK